MMTDTTGLAPTDRDQESQPAQQGAAGVSSQEPERFDADYVRKLRAEAADYRKRLRDLEQTVKAHEEAKLSETERLQKRLVELEHERELSQRERLERTLRYETMLAASRLGLVDPEVAYKLLDLTGIEFDADGAPKDVEKALKDLVKAKPYLAGQTPGSAGSPTNPATGQQRGGTFTRAQISDRAFWDAHRDEIMAALREGRIQEE